MCIFLSDLVFGSHFIPSQVTLFVLEPHWIGGFLVDFLCSLSSLMMDLTRYIAYIHRKVNKMAIMLVDGV